MHLKYYKNLDGLRGIAALSVIIYHFFHDNPISYNISQYPILHTITNLMQHGVTLFFVLSGFVITRILINTKQQENYFSQFYKKRALRIFPLYYLYLFVFFWTLSFLPQTGINTDNDSFFSVFFFLQNLDWITGFRSIAPGHYWSLAVEEHFYFLWPLIVFIIPNNRITRLTIILIILSLPLKYYFYTSGIDINHNTFSRYDSILLGALIAMFEQNPNYSLERIRKVFKSEILVLVILVLTGFIIYSFQKEFPLVKESFKHIILGVLSAIFIFRLINEKEDNWLYQFLTTDKMQYLGKISFGLYVWHMLIIQIMVYIGFKNPIVDLVLTIAFSILFAHLSYFYFERFFLQLKSWKFSEWY